MSIYVYINMAYAIYQMVNSLSLHTFKAERFVFQIMKWVHKIIKIFIFDFRIQNFCGDKER